MQKKYNKLGNQSNIIKEYKHRTAYNKYNQLKIEKYISLNCFTTQFKALQLHYTLLVVFVEFTKDTANSVSIFSGFLHGLDSFFTLLILFVKFARCTANSISISSGFHDGSKLLS